MRLGFVRLYRGRASGVVRSNSRPIKEAATRFPKHSSRVEMTYYVTDRLHNGRKVAVLGREIARTMSMWLAALGAHSPVVEDLARAACGGDWATACFVGDQLSVGVSVAAAG